MQKSHKSQPVTQVLSWIEGDDTKANNQQKQYIAVLKATSNMKQQKLDPVFFFGTVLQSRRLSIWSMVTSPQSCLAQEDNTNTRSGRYGTNTWKITHEFTTLYIKF